MRARADRGGEPPRPECDPDRRGGLFDKGGFLRARSAEDDAELQAVLARVLPPFGVQGAAGSTMISRPFPRPPLALHVNPVGRPETDLRVWPVAALVLVADPASRTRIDPAVAAEALGLTGKHNQSRQADLVRLVLALGGAPEPRH
ncbi:hypothetical protein [Candidatus Palauibacter sp.]|uniref:hypothetical protein n=1 Tax=Candidatus Palauibacter sp. TaxID=3101350 RepID=UPI003B5244E5